MRTLHAWLLAMALTIVVLISSTMVASAAEVETNEGEEVSIVNVEINNAPTSTQSVYDLKEIQYGDTTTGKTSYSGSFTLTTEQYITLVVNSHTDIIVTLLGLTGDAEDMGVVKKFTDNPNGQFTIYFVGGKFPTGKYNYTIRMADSTAPYAFYLLATDYPYN